MLTGQFTVDIDVEQVKTFLAGQLDAVVRHTVGTLPATRALPVGFRNRPIERRHDPPQLRPARISYVPRLRK